ncbi:MAG: amidohydrolase [Clostridiaceae bacterium]|nr:amidohydrolase [Clostridiaceae bacterium]
MFLLKNIDYLDQNFVHQKNVDILIEENIIKKIKPSDKNNFDKLFSKHNSDYIPEIIDGNNKVVLPGFYNMHSHVPMTLLRGYGEGLNLQDWLFTKIFPFENLLTAEDTYWGTLLGLSEFLASGTISFSDMYMRMPGIVKAIDEVGIKANLCNAITDFGPGIKFTETEAYRDEMFLLDYMKNNPTGKIIADAGIHAEYTSYPEQVLQLLEFAVENNLIIQLHLSETAFEHEECKQRHQGKTPTEYFFDLGVFQQKCILAHGVYVEEKDLRIIQQNNAVLVHNPASNLKLGSGFASVGKWLDFGVTACIGTDGAASNNDLDILQETRLAALIQKGFKKDPKLLKPEQLLQMITINGAIAQGRNNCGQIKEGNAADLVIFDLDTPNMQPIYDLATNIIYSVNLKNVFLTMVDGQILYQNGEYKTLDIEKVKFEVNRIKDEKLAQLSSS